MELRRLTLDDVPAAGRLTDAAFGGGPREDRLRRYLTLEPEGWFGVEERGELVASGGIVRFGSVAWLGLMAVRPDRQRRGLGRALAETAIGWARDRGSTTVRLIATAAGVPLYERLGFVQDGTSQELSGTPVPVAGTRAAGRRSVRPWDPEETAEVARFEAPASGVDRDRLLSAYVTAFPRSAWVARSEEGAVAGLLVVQDSMLGPWAAVDEGTAEQLLDVGLAGVRRPLRAGVLDPSAEELLLRRGFARTRALPRMRLGPPVGAAPSPRILAHASYAIG